MKRFFMYKMGENDSKEYRWRKDTLSAIFASSIVVVTLALCAFLIDFTSKGKTIHLVESLLPTTRFLASGILTASATILALMVTLLSLSQQTKKKLEDITLKRLKQIATLNTATFVLSVIFLNLHNVPISESEELSSTLLIWVYYSIVAVASINSGMLICVVLLLYFTMKSMISLISPNIDKD